MTSGLLFGGLGGALELRAQIDGSRTLRGSFPYRSRAVLSDGGRRGRPQKEEFEPGAFDYRIKDETAEIHLLVGHSYDKPLASKLSRTLTFKNTPAALLFDAIITPAVAATAHAKDALALLAAGLATGISPGFRMPPERAVPAEEAEEIIEEPNRPERGEHRAIIRKIRQALLFEMSIVTAPAYPDAQVEARNWAPGNRANMKPPEFLRRWRY